MPGSPLKYRAFIKNLRSYGVVVVKKRGKGSETYLLKPNSPGSKKGPYYTIKHHSDNDEIAVPVIRAVLRRLDIPEDEFWD